jgi:hypothetical protein
VSKKRRVPYTAEGVDVLQIDVVIAEKHADAFRVRLNLKDPVDCRTIHWFATEEWASADAARINGEIKAMVQDPDVPSPDPRPDDPAELARQVAKELRKRTWAEARPALGGHVWFVWVARLCHNGRAIKAELGDYSPTDPTFAGMGPVAITNEIVRQEALRAQEWAGDSVD